MQDKLCNLLKAVHVHAPQPSIAASVTRTVDISPAGKQEKSRPSSGGRASGRDAAQSWTHHRCRTCATGSVLPWLEGHMCRGHLSVAVGLVSLLT